jgi:hypothetical protein
LRKPEDPAVWKRQRDKRFGAPSLCGQRLHRAVHKNRAELGKLQTERKIQQQAAAPPEPKPIAVNDTQSPADPNGFVHANGIPAVESPDESRMDQSNIMPRLIPQRER